MQKKTRKRIITVLKIIVALYIAGGAVLYFFQDRFIFRGTPLPPDHVFRFDIPFREIYLPVNNEKNLSIVQFTVPDSLCKGVVLYFHGNRRNIERYAVYATHFTDRQYEIWMIDYPGYGKSTGELTEESLYEDADLFYKMARSRFAADSIIIYGKSIGTGIAARLASRVNCKRLILETPYYSFDALLHYHTLIYPVSWMTKYDFPTYKYITGVNAPVTLIHGTSDKVISYSQAKRLAALKPGTELITIPKGKHSGLSEFPLYQQQLDVLLR